ncbi:ankyrin repeat-containing domain protein [Lactarius deliciosus]|nr:ankyrin repeat-containing domain protein [Lactarius deliciosus]
MAAAQILRLTHDAKVVLQQTSNSVDDVKWNQLRESLRRWVTPPDPSTNHNIACDIHHGGTAEWFYQGSTFAEWKSTGSLLWIYGKPGSGKSILCSTIIQDIASLREAGSALMVYFYFDFRDLDKQHRRNLLPSLLIQLSAQSRPCCDILSHLYSIHDNGDKKPSDSVMIRCLKDMLTILNPQPVYIILDALDECPNWPGIPSPREQVLAFVKELVDLHLPHLHICVTSRPEFDIRATLTPLAHHRVSLHDESGQKKDIVNYLNSVVYSDSETMMKRWREDDKKMVVEALSEKADGMFRWVFCQLETLRHCLPSGVRQTLAELPESLDETYERIVMDIKKTNSAHAYRMLQCLAVAIRPLSVAELAELLAFDFNATKGGIPELNPNWRWEDHEQAVLSTCSSLITIVLDDDSPVVQFSHFSVKEFLMSDRLSTPTKDLSRFHIVPEDANTLIARACLGVLLRDPVGEDSTATAPLAGYAAEYWVTHAQVENVVPRILDGMEYLFDPDRPYFSAWVKLYHVHSDWADDLKSKTLPRVAPLYYAAHCGFRQIVERLTLKYPQYTNAIGGRTGTALHSASAEGHVEVVRSLLKYGADVNARGIRGQSPLQLASYEGHLNVVRCLLDYGADAEFRSDFRMTPLTNAATWGTLEIVRVLLEHNVDVNSQDEDGMTPIHQLLFEGRDSKFQSDHPQIVRLLLEHGADPNIRDNKRRTPLHLVSSPRLVLSLRLEIARILLAHGADVGAEDEEGRTPLQVALARRQDEIVQLLSDYCK